MYLPPVQGSVGPLVTVELDWVKGHYWKKITVIRKAIGGWD